MATNYSDQYNAAYVAVPSTKIAPGDDSGGIKFKYFSFTVPTVAPTNGDIFKLFKLPKGAKLVDFEMSFPDLGSAGVVNVGWAASAEVTPGTTTPIEAASAAGILSAVDVNTAAAIVNMADVAGAAVAGYLKEFAAEVDVQLAVSTAWTAVAGTVVGYAKYVNV